jgi:uncharacterized protein (UPF0333 family)
MARMRKAQVSMELLIVFLIFLAVLMFSLSALSAMAKRNADTQRLMQARMAYEDISNAASNACILGSGNSRKVAVPITVDVMYSDVSSEITVRSEEHEFSRYIPCKVEEKYGFNGTVYVQNNNGIIEIEG